MPSSAAAQPPELSRWVRDTMSASSSLRRLGQSGRTACAHVHSSSSAARRGMSGTRNSGGSGPPHAYSRSARATAGGVSRTRRSSSWNVRSPGHGGVAMKSAVHFGRNAASISAAVTGSPASHRSNAGRCGLTHRRCTAPRSRPVSAASTATVSVSGETANRPPASTSAVPVTMTVTAVASVAVTLALTPGLLQPVGPQPRPVPARPADPVSRPASPRPT